MMPRQEVKAEFLSLPVLKAILVQVRVGVLITDPQRRIVYVNSAFTATTGYKLDEIAGLPCSFLQGANTDPADVVFLREALNAQRPVERSILNYHKQGYPIRYRLNITPIFEADALICFVGLQEDYTLVHRQHQELEQAAYIDDLTQLGNRRAFREALEYCDTLQRPFALLMLDLDQFKQVNDTHGHARGDEILRQIAACLQAFTVSGETVFRQGGDEFTILITQEEQVHDRIQAWKKMLETASRQVISVSVGIAHFPEDSQDVWNLYRQADKAMYLQKRRSLLRK